MIIAKLSRLRSLVVLTTLLFLLTFLAVSFHHHANQQINQKCPICSIAKYIASADSIEIFDFRVERHDSPTVYLASSTRPFFQVADSIRSRSPPLAG